MLDLEKMTLSDLKVIAKENNIKNISKLKKEELIEILKKVLKTENQSEDLQEDKKVEKFDSTNTERNAEPTIDYKLTLFVLFL